MVQTMVVADSAPYICLGYKLIIVKRTILYLLTACLLVFMVDKTYGQSWNFLEKVAQSKRAVANDLFGQHVCIDGDYAMIGCWRNDFNKNGGDYIDDAGAAYLYQKSEAGVWSSVKKIVASDRKSTRLNSSH